MTTGSKRPSHSPPTKTFFCIPANNELRSGQSLILLYPRDEFHYLTHLLGDRLHLFTINNDLYTDGETWEQPNKHGQQGPNLLAGILVLLVYFTLDLKV